ncbi:MAG: aldehyde dehydrogenase family protein [Rhodoluna sp.]|jgi:acyl-CoA reductase-like NAD-dependent aldehyde dehydrogenase
MSYTLINPTTEESMETIEHFSEAQADEAIDRAQKAQLKWAALSPGDRAMLLRRFARRVDEDIETLAQLEVRNSGHPIDQARYEAGNVRDVLDYYAGAPERLMGKQIPVAGGIAMTFHEPIGVVGMITPWNYPMPIAGWGFAPALAAGNAVVLKPAEWTPLTSLRMAELGLEAGLPEHLFQIVTGQGQVAGNRLVTNEKVGKIVFTGSTAVGKSIMRTAADQIKRITLELGGKSANVIFDDADIAKAAKAAPYAVFENAGQDCCARSRILVQDTVFDKFMAELEPAVAGVKVGDPSLTGTEVGPLVSKKHLDTVTSYLEGAEVAFRGTAPTGKGFFFAPTVVVAKSLQDRCMSEEIFGPVVTVYRFKDEAEAISIANATEYGLSGSIWTKDLARGIRVSRGIQSGNLSVNSHSSLRYHTPFGGMKQSGMGRELGPDAPYHFTEEKVVFFNQED